MCLDVCYPSSRLLILVMTETSSDLNELSGRARSAQELLQAVVGNPLGVEVVWISVDERAELLRQRRHVVGFGARYNKLHGVQRSHR